MQSVKDGLQNRNIWTTIVEWEEPGAAKDEESPSADDPGGKGD
jgi:hypothetical protein